jgi:hypothetical protein
MLNCKPQLQNVGMRGELSDTFRTVLLLLLLHIYIFSGAGGSISLVHSQSYALEFKPVLRMQSYANTS